MTIGFGLIGFIDDFKKLVLKDTKGLSPRYKIFGLLAIATAYIIYLINVVHIGTETFIPFIKTYIEIPIYIYIPFAIFVMLAVTNAINLTDGVDGLSTSISAIIATCLTVIAIVLDVKEIIVFGSIIVGACLGFLIFNLNKAKVFMGDTRLTSFRRSNSCNDIIFKNAITFINCCTNSSNRDSFCIITSNIFQKNRW
jgi:phospho-N-acetylmuramoyl-pentapeptide-transferase